MGSYQECHDFSDTTELFGPQGLFLKPIARLNVSVQLPSIKLPGKSISNWEVMEKLRQMIKPEEFTVLKVSKSTLEFIRFECEIENKSKLNNVIRRLDNNSFKLSGFPEMLKVRAAEAKIPFPTRHTWDSFFRDAKNMNEMKPGERPDTIHISNVPTKWFTTKQDTIIGNDLPSEYLLRKVFEVFGEVRCVDIPKSDEYRTKMNKNISGIQMFSFGQDHLFEAYVQFKEYICFVKAMDALRGKKLLFKDEDRAYTANIKVDFDKTKHLSDASIQKRRTEREKIIAKEREEEERLQKELELKQKKEEEERQRDLMQKRLEKEKEKLLRLKKKEEKEINKRIEAEEKKLILAQRKLESIRLLDFLLQRIKNEDNPEKKLQKRHTAHINIQRNQATLKDNSHRHKSFHKHTKPSCTQVNPQETFKEEIEEKTLKRKTEKEQEEPIMKIKRREANLENEERLQRELLEKKEFELRNKLLKKYGLLQEIDNKKIEEDKLQDNEEKPGENIETQQLHSNERHLKGKPKLKSVLGTTKLLPDTSSNLPPDKKRKVDCKAVSMHNIGMNSFHYSLNPSVNNINYYNESPGKPRQLPHAISCGDQWIYQSSYGRNHSNEEENYRAENHCPYYYKNIGEDYYRYFRKLARRERDSDSSESHESCSSKSKSSNGSSKSRESRRHKYSTTRRSTIQIQPSSSSTRKCVERSKSSKLSSCGKEYRRK